jgi:hypothetical protein
LKPRELLLFRIEPKFLPFLEQLGFRFSESQIKLSRNIEGWRQSVSFSLSKWNSENDCTFWTMWAVNSPEYSKWYQKEWGQKPANNALGGCADWNIPGWTRDPTVHFRLDNSSKDLNEVDCLIENSLQAGIPYLDTISNWRGAAESLIASGPPYSKAADFLMIDRKSVV